MHRVSDIELASRLSFFLWSSVPDDELLALAEKGRLRDRSVLEAQVRRMIVDRKSQALVSNFAGQWLYIRNLRGTNPDRMLYPDFDDNLRRSFQREMEMFFESIIREDRNVLDLMTLNAGSGTQLDVEACGDDAAAAVAEVVHLFETKFEVGNGPGS